MITIAEILDEFGDFTWFFGNQFFVETRLGNFVWSCPDYYGDNSFTPFKGTCEDFEKTVGHFGRSKGLNLIRNYCGDGITLNFGDDVSRVVI